MPSVRNGHAWRGRAGDSPSLFSCPLCPASSPMTARFRMPFQVGYARPSRGDERPGEDAAVLEREVPPRQTSDPVPDPHEISDAPAARLERCLPYSGSRPGGAPTCPHSKRSSVLVSVHRPPLRDSPTSWPRSPAPVPRSLPRAPTDAAGKPLRSGRLGAFRPGNPPFTARKLPRARGAGRPSPPARAPTGERRPRPPRCRIGRRRPETGSYSSELPRGTE